MKEMMATILAMGAVVIAISAWVRIINRSMTALINPHIWDRAEKLLIAMAACMLIIAAILKA